MKMTITYFVPYKLTVNVINARDAKNLFHSLPLSELARRGDPAFDVCPSMLREIAAEDGSRVTDIEDQALPGVA